MDPNGTDTTPNFQNHFNISMAYRKDYRFAKMYVYENVKAKKKNQC